MPNFSAEARSGARRSDSQHVGGHATNGVAGPELSQALPDAADQRVSKGVTDSAAHLGEAIEAERRDHHQPLLRGGQHGGDVLLNRATVRQVGGLIVQSEMG